jgi:soluble lytic murein transglycosylase-like protein
MDYFVKDYVRKILSRVIVTLVYLFFGSSLVQATSQFPNEILKQASNIRHITGIVSEADSSRYRVIFGLQENGDWVAADKIIETLSNKVLMGHLLAQRYLHPTKYRSRYKELKNWLDNYGDHPEASQIYKLALKRRPRNWKLPKEPTSVRYVKPYARKSYLGYLVYNPRKSLKRTERQEHRQLSRQMRYYLRKGWTKSYKKLVRSDRVSKLFHIVELDRAKSQLAAGYYADGRDQWAYDWANRAIRRSGKYLPEAHWVAALSAWRLARFSVSRKHFEAVSSSVYSSPWLVSAGAFWAARASIKVREPALYSKYLEIASAYPRTFYGIVARRLLGLGLKYNWTMPPLEAEALLELANAPGGQRAIALLQIGKDRRAERELKLLFRAAKPELARAMMAVIDRAEMPSLAMRIGNLLVISGSSLYDSTTYPAPTLPTKNGDVSDRSLVLALIRQESRFNPKAKSHRGARGLLQLMPRTASYVASDRKLRGSKKDRDVLFDPKTNLSLGKKYINILMNDKAVKGDLFRMLAAWNGGPGNLNKWMRNVKYGDDPLLFIESIPSKETRIFIERVLTNYWIYQSRFGNNNRSLDLVAEGKWPGYRAYPGVELELAEE